MREANVKQPFINKDLTFFIHQIKLRFVKSILQSRSTLLTPYCNYETNKRNCNRAHETLNRVLARLKNANEREFPHFISRNGSNQNRSCSLYSLNIQDETTFFLQDTLIFPFAGATMGR